MKPSLRKKEVIEIKDQFMALGTRSVDSKHRITLGEKLYKAMSDKMKIDSYQIFAGKSGDILLRPVVSIPSSEFWVYNNSKVLKKFRKRLRGEVRAKEDKLSGLEGFLNV